MNIALRRIVYLFVIILLAIADFMLIQNLMLTNNITVAISVLYSMLFCFGFVVGPILCGMGLVGFGNKMKTDENKQRSVIFLLFGALCTGLAFLIYFFICINAIVEKSGFNYVDLFTMFSPLMTSIVVFCFSILIMPRDFDDTHNTQRDYTIERLRERLLKNTLSESDIAEIKSILIDFQNNLQDNVTPDELQENFESIKQYVESQVSNSLHLEKTNDILELMLENMAEINEYFKISKKHARSSFRLAYLTCIAGIVLLIASILMYFQTYDLNPSIITVISGSVVELFSGTALWVHRKSLNQLNHYYDALHNNERFLSIVNIVSKVSEGKQDEVYIEIIKNEMEIMKDSARK